MLNPTTVVNLRKTEFDVYIGRSGHGQDGIFGNPHSVEKHGREQCISLFHEYFHARIKNDPEFRYRVHQLRGKRLGCFCKPKKCHGDIIAEYLNQLPENTSIKLAVVGSRTFNDYQTLTKVLSWYNINTIISGGATGADKMAAKYAQELNINLIEHIPDWNIYGKRAGFVRNRKIIEHADEVVAFWDGISNGTKDSIRISQELNKPIYVHKFSCQFDIDTFLQ